MKTYFFVLFFLSLVFIGCHHSTEPPVSSDQPGVRDLNSIEKTVVASDNSFGFKLFARINSAEQNKNVFISPFSVSMALGMALNGADGTTLDSMKQVLEQSNVTMQEINDSYKNVSAIFMSLDPKVTFQIANSIWYKTGFDVLPSFLADCRTYFDAQVASLDFSSPDALTTINNWVSSKTNGKIPAILTEIPSYMVMYLINAEYFKGLWTYQFDPANTAGANFTTSTGNTVACSMMSQKATYAYHSEEQAQIIDLPYGDRLFSMTIVLPKTGTDIDEFARELTRQQWDALVNNLDSTQVILSLPKFKLEYESKLNDDLIAMGMGIAFTDGANFSRMSQTPLKISEVKHKTFVEVNEEGTEAAAVTSVGMRTMAIASTPVMRIDRPFIFAIREHSSGSILFIGKIVNPNS